MVRNKYFVIVGLVVVGAVIWLGLGWFGQVKAQFFGQCGTGSTKADGLVSAFSIDPNFTGGGCVSGSLSYIPLNQTKIVISNYDSLFNKYYQQNNTVTKVALGPSYTDPIENFAELRLSPPPYLLYRNGDLSLQGSVLANTSSGNVIVVFVNGNLNIQTDITQARDNQAGGVVLVVKGQVNIDPGVKTINAVIVAEGQICTACDINGTATNNSVYPFDNQLVINGSLISLDQQRPIRFVRQYVSNTQPAELINAQAKYLVILKDIFGERIKVYQEI